VRRDASVTQEQLPIALVAAGLPSLPGRLATAKSYAERLFSYPVVGRLSDGDARAALTVPLPTSITMAADALDDLVEFAEGYPLLLQLVGKHAWDLADGPEIGRPDVALARPAAFDSLSRELFLARWQRATPCELGQLVLGREAEAKLAIATPSGWLMLPRMGTLSRADQGEGHAVVAETGASRAACRIDAFA